MGYLSNLYLATMQDAYAFARKEIVATGGRTLDCGAGDGHELANLEAVGFNGEWEGVEWDADTVAKATSRGLKVAQGDLNERIPFDDDTFDCVYGLSVLEHILKPCSYILEAKRVLKPGGKLVLLTPNIATYFTALNILRGRMPSSGPHPDSNALAAMNEFGMSPYADAANEGDTPTHRHLVVFSYSALGNYLRIAGFRSVEGSAFGYYPFPRFMQPAMQKLDPWHCHQMVYTAIK